MTPVFLKSTYFVLVARCCRRECEQCRGLLNLHQVGFLPRCQVFPRIGNGVRSSSIASQLNVFLKTQVKLKRALTRRSEAGTAALEEKYLELAKGILVFATP